MKLYKSAASVCILASLLASCGENAWNDHLDGFKDDQAVTDVKAVEYTLTDANYSTIASLSANVALAGADSLALRRVGTAKAFSIQAPASKYVPAFLETSGFPYYLLDNGSSVKITYRQQVDAPAEIDGIENADEYIVSDADYQGVWGSDTDYTPSFSPKHTAAASLPRILQKAFPDAEAGQYVIVNYNTSDIDPTFGGTPGPNPPEEFTLSSVIGSVEVDKTYDINGIVTGVSTNGFILTDNTGSIFVYMKDAMDATKFKVGAQVIASALIGSYNKGFQVVGESSTFEVKGEQSYTYPTPKVFTVTDIEAIAKHTDNTLAQYGSITGKVKVSGNNINIDMGSENAMGGVYYATDEIKAKLTDGAQVTVTGYQIAVAASRYVNFVATSVEPVPAARRHRHHRVVAVPSQNVNAVYTFSGTAWQPAARTTMLNPSDYTAMGLNQGYISDAAFYITRYLKQKYPYAKEGDAYFVVYRGGTSASSASIICSQYIFDGSEWNVNNNVEIVTEQYVRVGGHWMYDPNVVITLPYGRNQAFSAPYYQACVDWVYENIDVPLGSTSIKSGIGYVTTYGNNDYYCGASAYQNNVDLRPNSARTQYPQGYEGMTDEQIVELEKARFCKQVFPQALAKLHPDATPVAGIDVFYTINFGAYDGSATTMYSMKYKVIGQGQFEFVECDWWKTGTTDIEP